MAVGAVLTQIVSVALVNSTTAMPMAWMMLTGVLATGAVYVGLVKRVTVVPGDH